MRRTTGVRVDGDTYEHAVVDDTIAVVGVDDQLTGVDVRTGKRTWEVPAPGSGSNPSFVDSGHGELSVMTGGPMFHRKHVSALDPRTDQVREQRALPSRAVDGYGWWAWVGDRFVTTNTVTASRRWWPWCRSSGSWRSPFHHPS